MLAVTGINQTCAGVGLKTLFAEQLPEGDEIY